MQADTGASESLVASVQRMSSSFMDEHGQGNSVFQDYAVCPSSSSHVIRGSVDAPPPPPAVLEAAHTATAHAATATRTKDEVHLELKEKVRS